MDKYTKLQKIGQGSFGSAFLCVKKHDPHGRKFVMKEIRMDPRDQHTALREAKLLAALDHPNIIACRESFLAAPNVLCIVTEFADGGDLRKQLTDRAARRSPLSEPELLDLFLQCCLALKHLHDRKIIHRDIKPENIFLTSSQVVKLGDFGVATVLSHTLACAQTLTGTPYYTSPEICLGKKYTNKTDVWSLGCVLYELATFSHAFNGRSQRQLFENIVHGSVVPIASSASYPYSPRLVALVGEMLQKNPRDRPNVNQLIRRPVLFERAQRFLSQHAVADALNHTVLHGQHIFQRPPPVPATANQPSASPAKRPQPQSQPQPGAVRRPAAAAVRAVQYEPPKSRKKPEPVAPRRGMPMAAGAARRNSLKSSGSKRNILRKLVSPKKPQAKREQAKAAAMVLPPPPPVSAVAAPVAMAHASPAMRQIQQRLQQRKQDAAAQRPNRAPVEGAAKTPVAKQHDKPKPKAAASPAPSSRSSSVSDRVSAFNAQWQAQRKQILRNLAAPPASAALPPPPASAVPVRKPEPAAVTPPPPAPLLATGVVVQRGEKPSSAAALAAAKQREAMRRDIQEKKQQHALAKRGSVSSVAAASPSPLDDPVILVQNLPAYKKPKPAPKALGLPPPPAAAAPVAVAQDQEGEEVEMEMEMEEEEEEDVPTPDSTVVEKANVEFQRMLLQLQSVVDEPEHADDEDNDDEEDAVDTSAPARVAVAPLDSTGGSSKHEELRGTMTLPPPSYEALDSVEKPGGVMLCATILEDPGFKAALRAALRGSTVTGSEPLATIDASAKALAWMHQYISEVLGETPRA